MHKVLLLLFLFLCSQNLYSQSGDTLTRSFEFRIYKDGRLLKEKKNKAKLVAIVSTDDFGMTTNEYEELANTSQEPGRFRYTYNYGETDNQYFFLKIYSGKDSMIVLTEASLDSLAFQPGEYYYSADYVNYINIKPADSSVHITSSKSDWNKVMKKNSSAYRSSVSLPWLNNQYRYYCTDTTINYIYYPFSDIYINPNDSSLYLYYSFRLVGSKNFGESYTEFYECKPNEDIKKIYVKEGKTKLIISRNEIVYEVDLEYFLKNGKLKDTIDKASSYYKTDDPESIAFRPDENYDFSVEQLDSCLVYLKYKGERIFSFNCDASIPTSNRELPYENQWGQEEPNAYYNALPKYEYILGNRIFLEFRNCFLYSEDGKNWTYYSFRDLYYRSQYLDSFLPNDTSLEVYLLKDKTLLLAKRDRGIFTLDVIR